MSICLKQLAEMNAVKQSEFSFFRFVHDTEWRCNFKLNSAEIKLELNSKANDFELAIQILYDKFQATRSDGIPELKQTKSLSGPVRDLDEEIPF